MAFVCVYKHLVMCSVSFGSNAMMDVGIYGQMRQQYNKYKILTILHSFMYFYINYRIQCDIYIYIYIYIYMEYFYNIQDYSK